MYPYDFPECSLDALYDFRSKKKSVSWYVRYMLARTQAMFEYKGLPDTIPQRFLELYLQCNGQCVITDVNGELYALTGGLGGVPDPYYFPTQYIVANPALHYNKSLTIGKDCVLIPGDSSFLGLLPLFRRYASLLVENDITMRMADINLRNAALISASDDANAASAKQYLRDLEDGKPGVIADPVFLDGIRVQPYAMTQNTLTDLIEYTQYLKAAWYNDIGLDANYNMKREAINSSEAQMNDDALLPLIDDMLRCRRTALEKVNEMYGTNISVHLYSTWAIKEDEPQQEEAAPEQEEEPQQEGENDDAEEDT